VETWNKVVAGLLRMYEGEVLGKLPVVQHLNFGTLLKWNSEFKD
jgi:serine/threonine-protein phosphatase 2A activator